MYDDEISYERKQLPMNVQIALHSIIDEYKDYAHEILEAVAYKCVSYNPDASAMFLTDFISKFTKATLQTKNKEIGNINNIATFCCHANNLLHRKYARKIDKTELHIALHTLAYMYKSDCPKYLAEHKWAKKYCQALYDHYKDKNLDEVAQEHFTYKENKYVVPFLKNLVAKWEKLTSEPIH